MTKNIFNIILCLLVLNMLKQCIPNSVIDQDETPILIITDKTTTSKN